MNDETMPAWGADPERIDISRDYELRDWAHRLDATPQQVSQALLAVGDRAADVATHLRCSRIPAPAPSTSRI